MTGLTRAGLGILWYLAVAASVAVTLTFAKAGTFAAATRQETFALPERATDALIAAARTGDRAALLKVLGTDAEKLISSGDPVADRRARSLFLAAYDAAHALQSRGADEVILIVGKESWPLPIPLVRQGAVWRFDTAAGEKEILDRRVGRNELNVIEVCRTYVEAQREYAAEDRTGSGHLEYAQHLVSAPGKRDGLYWPASAGTPESPFGPLIARARAEGYFKQSMRDGARPYHGYYYKILKRQGPHAPGGARNYVVAGHLTGGFAMLAFPASYGDSGIMTFMVNQDGIVYQKDLGPRTTSLARNITEFDPDRSWKIP